MKIEEEKSPSPTYFLCATIIIFFIIIWLIVSFMTSCYDLADHFINNTKVIILNRGATAGLGGAIALFPFIFVSLLVGVMKKPVTQIMQNVFGYGMIIGIPLMFLLPIVSFITISTYASNEGYISCDEAEYKYSRLASKTVYYTKDDTTCTELVEEVKRDRPFL